MDGVKPNQYSIEDKVAWLSFIDQSIINDVLLTHEGYDGRYDDFTGYSADNLTVGLIAPSPYDRLYTAYLKMKIDEENGETARYNNSATLFNSYLAEYKKWYNRNHMPLGNRRPAPPQKHTNMDVSDAQLEQLRKLLYAELHNDVLSKLSDDKIYAIVKKFVDTNAQMLKGKDGISIIKADVKEDGHLYIHLTSGVTVDAGKVKDEVYNSVVLKDAIDGKLYRIRVVQGKLTMEGVEE